MHWLFIAIVLLECQNLMAVWRGWVIDIDDESWDDYTIVVPVYGDPRYFRERRGAFADSGPCDPGPGSNSACHDCLRGRDGKEGLARPPGAPRLQCGPDTMVKAVLEDGAVSTSWMIRIDADSYAVEDFGKAIAAATAQAQTSAVSSASSRALAPCANDFRRSSTRWRCVPAISVPG